MRQMDAPALRVAIIEAGGPSLDLLKPLPGGAVGAWKVRWPDGHIGVLTWAPPPLPEDPPGQLAQAAALVDVARSAGVPIPRYEAVIDVGEHGAAIVQELAKGVLPTTVTAGLIERLIEFAEVRRGLLFATPHNAQPMKLYLRSPGPGFCLHQPLRSYSPRSATLLEAIEATEVSRDEVVGDDLVHFDYHLGNVLVDPDRPDVVTAILDWDGARAGPIGVDLAILAFDLTWRVPAAPQAQVENHLLTTTPADLIPPLWAHASLRLVDWAIRHHSPADVEHWLGVAETHLRG